MDFWQEIRKPGPPVVMYGTGNAADKLYHLLEERGVRVEGCFVNDEFVRSRTFQGYKVLSYERAKSIFGEMRVVMGFGSHDPKVLGRVKEIASETDFWCPDLLQDEEGHLFDEEYCRKHRRDLEYAYGLLSDDQSRKVFQKTIENKLSGRIGPLFEIETDERENWKILGIGEDETYMDLGAYNGDTIERFLSFTPSFRRIIGVEPERRSFRILSGKLEGMENVDLVNAAIGEVEEEVLFSSAGRGSKVGEGRKVVQRTIDGILGGSPVSILKFDIEGEEEKALRGGKESISRWKPRMVLSAYHRIDDLWRLPRCIEEYRKDYRWYLRHSPSVPAWEVDYFLV